MKPLDPIQSMHRAARRHPFEDGITEILIGVLLAVAALIIHRPAGAILVLAVAVALARVLPKLKDRVTTPRAGSATVAAERPGKAVAGMAMYGAACGAAVAAVWIIAAVLGVPLGKYRWVPVFTGLFLSGGFLHVARTAHLGRFYLYLAATVGGGIFSALTMEGASRQAAYASLTTLFWALSALLVFAGSAVLIRFIRRNPVFDRSQLESHGQ